MVACNALWGPGILGNGESAYQTNMGGSWYMQGVNYRRALVTRVPFAGTVNAVGVHIKSVYGNPPAAKLGIVTVGTDGHPTVTAYGGSAAEEYDFTAAGFQWVTLSTPATMTAGDIVAAQIWPGTSAPDGSNCLEFYTRPLLGPIYGGLPRSESTADGSTFAQLPGMEPIAYRYDDGTIVGMPLHGLATDNYDSADTPDEEGNLFQVPVGMTVYGLRVSFFSLSADASFTAKLYNAANTLLASCTVDDIDKLVRRDYLFDVDLALDDAITLDADTDYRLTLLATHATATIRPLGITFAAAADRAGLPEGARWQKTQRTDAGAWTDTATALTYMALWVSDITVAAGGGGSAAPHTMHYASLRGSL